MIKLVDFIFEEATYLFARQIDLIFILYLVLLNFIQVFDEIVDCIGQDEIQVLLVL
jgi:hypothetical protein